MRTKFQNEIKTALDVYLDSTFLVAVSGGVDSMVLADCMKSLSLKFGIAHCNYHLRGEDSKLDAKLVMEWAHLHNICFHMAEFPINPDEKSIQENARQLRLQYFEKIKSEFGYQFILTAHHKGDVIENFLFRLLNGSGLRGMVSIENNFHFSIKPFLNIHKTELYEYAAQYQVPFREDASNLSSKYSRNQLRNQIIPLFEKIKPGSLTSIQQSLSILAQAYDFITKKKEEWVSLNVLKHQNHSIIKIPKEDDLYLLNEYLVEFGFNFSILQDLKQQIHQAGKVFYSNTGFRITTGKGYLNLERVEELKLGKVIFIESLPIQCSLELGEIKLTLNKETEPTIRNESSFKRVHVDLQQIKWPLKIEYYQPGDKIKSLGLKGKSKKLKKIFMERGTDMQLRKKWPIVKSGNEIIWVPGHAMSELVKCGEATKEIAVFNWCPY